MRILFRPCLAYLVGTTRPSFYMFLELHGLKAIILRPLDVAREQRQGVGHHACDGGQYREGHGAEHAPQRGPARVPDAALLGVDSDRTAVLLPHAANGRGPAPPQRLRTAKKIAYK